MKILYVTNIWVGFDEIIYYGKTAPSGMPAFNRPLKAIIEAGHQVNFLLISEKECPATFNIGVSWLNASQFLGVIKRPQLGRIVAAIKIYSEVKQILMKEKYDFVYAHGPIAEPARIAAGQCGVNFGQRLYGTFLADYIEKNGVLKAWLQSPFEALSFYTRKDFLLVTNDGSRGDRAQQAICKTRKPYEFCFWLNGVDKNNNGPADTIIANNLTRPYLFYVARIDPWKRQDLAVDLISLLKQRGVSVTLYFAGQICNQAYFDSIMAKAKLLGVQEQVVYLGTISGAEVRRYCKDSLASLLFQDVTNMGNVFHEFLAEGAVIIAKDNGSLDDFLCHNENGFFVDSMAEAASVVVKLLDSDAERQRISQNARDTSKAKMVTWEERIHREIELIKKNAGD